MTIIAMLSPLHLLSRARLSDRSFLRPDGGRRKNRGFDRHGINSPQTLSLTGTGEDFSMGASGSASATIAAGQTATYTIAFAAMGGFTQPIAPSCSGAP